MELSNNGFIGRYVNSWSYRQINNFATFSVISYLIKFLIDMTMYIFMVYDPEGNYYVYEIYLLPPHIISSIFMVVYYLLYFKKIFLGWVFKISSVIILVVNIIFVVVLFFDLSTNLMYYFSYVGLLNFLNALFLKCNIIPARRVGSAEVAPLIFEITCFVAMVFGILATIFGFPILREDKNQLLYINVDFAFKFNIISNAILLVCYFWTRRNNSAFIRDNMFDEGEFDEEYDGF